MNKYTITSEKTGEVIEIYKPTLEDAIIYAQNFMDQSHAPWTVAKELTQNQREKLIEICIDSDIEAMDRRGLREMFYEGVSGYKSYTDDELIQQIIEWELIEDFILDDWLEHNK
jgi:hypothetical protein